MNLFISPHQDDETLFGAFTLLRERPLVLLVTSSYIQAKRGDGITNDMRTDETIDAMRILDCPVIFGDIRDDEITEEMVGSLLVSFIGAEKVYAPKPYPNGNPHHNLIGEVAKEVFGDKVIFYSTYTKDNLYMTGKTEIIPTPKELELKNKALQCYKSQLSLGSTRPHFEAVLGRSEWYD